MHCSSRMGEIGGRRGRASVQQEKLAADNPDGKTFEEREGISERKVLCPKMTKKLTLVNSE